MKISIKKEIKTILIIFSLLLLTGICTKAQIIIDTIDVSKMSKAQLRIVMKNYNRALVLENDKLKIQVKAEIRNNEIARKKYNDSLKGMNSYFKNQVRYKLDSAKKSNNLIIDSINKSIKKLNIELVNKNKENRIALRKIKVYKTILIVSLVFIILIILWFKRKLL